MGVEEGRTRRVIGREPVRAGVKPPSDVVCNFPTQTKYEALFFEMDT